MNRSLFLAAAIALSGCTNFVRKTACSQDRGIPYTDESGTVRCILPGETAKVTHCAAGACHSGTLANDNEPRTPPAASPTPSKSGRVTTCREIGAGEERCFTK